MTYTILGASGFVGSHLAARLRARGEDVICAPRDDWSHVRGHVIYSVGITADYRTRPIETVDAHVSRLAELLKHATFDSFLYLSSTRVYAGADRGVEDATFRVDHDVYNVSKLMGEALCLAIPKENIRVARLSNVFGPDWGSRNFLSTVIAEAVDSGTLVFRTAADSAKDYIGIDDVVDALLAIVECGRERITNVASGTNITNGEIAARIAELTGCETRFEDGAPSIVFPVIDCARVRRITPHAPTPLLDALPSLIADYKRWKSDDSH